MADSNFGSGAGKSAPPSKSTTTTRPSTESAETGVNRPSTPDTLSGTTGAGTVGTGTMGAGTTTSTAPGAARSSITDTTSPPRPSGGDALGGTSRPLDRDTLGSTTRPSTGDTLSSSARPANADLTGGTRPLGDTGGPTSRSTIGDALTGPGSAGASTFTGTSRTTGTETMASAHTAATTGTGSTLGAGPTGRDTYGTTGGTSGTLGTSQVGDNRIFDRDTMSRMSGQTSDTSQRMQGKASEAMRRGADKLEELAGRVDTYADSRLDREGGVKARAGAAAHGFADTVETFSRYLRDGDTQALRTDLEAQARKNPLAAVGIGIGFGFLLGKLLR